MRIRLALTLDVRREPKTDDETGLGSDTTKAETHTGPSMGFRIPDQQPEWADRQASK